MKVYGNLEAAQLESLVSDPAQGVNGRAWLNSTSKFPKIDDGAAVRRVVTDNDYNYFGVPNADGTWPDDSWRILISGTLLQFQRKITGVWTTQGEFGV